MKNKLPIRDYKNTKNGKERENSYRKIKRFTDERYTQTHGSLIGMF